LVNDAVTTAKINGEEVTSADIKDDTIQEQDISEGAILCSHAIISDLQLSIERRCCKLWTNYERAYSVKCSNPIWYMLSEYCLDILLFSPFMG
jgi:hypothetical protein